MSFFLEQLHRAKAEASERNADPLREKVESLVRGMEAISTHSLLDLLGLLKTTGNGRRIAATMRSLGFIPTKSRRLMPGGWADTVTRGWARPVREPPFKQGNKVESLHPKPDDEQKACHVQS